MCRVARHEAAWSPDSSKFETRKDMPCAAAPLAPLALLALLALRLGAAAGDAGSARGDRLCKYRLGDVVKGAIPKHSGAKIYGRTARDYPESLAARYLREAGGRHGQLRVLGALVAARFRARDAELRRAAPRAVSYTHLTLPTILLV